MTSLALLMLAIGPAGASDLEAQVKEIFEESCTACHDASSDDVVLEGSLDHLRADSSTGTPLVKPGDPDGSYLYQKMLGAEGIKGEAMPMGDDPLPQEKLAVVRDWIASLQAAEPEPEPAAEPAAGDVDHEAMVRAIFEDSCTSCHGEGAETVALAGPLEHLRGASSAGIAYVVPGDPDASYLYQKLVGADGIQGSTMPMGEDPLPEMVIQEIRDWIAAMPEESWTQPGVEPLPLPEKKQRPGFAGTHQVALHTTTTLGKKTVEFRIHHRFGEIRRPFYDRTFFGLAAGAKMSIGAAYGITDGLDVLVRWTNARVGNEIGIKYVPIRQEDGWPVSFGLYGSFEQYWDKPLEGCIARSHCTVGSGQAMLSRFWFDRWATQLTVGYSALTNHSPDYQDEVDGELHDLHDERGTFDVGLASTVWLDKRKKWGLDVEYFLPLPIEQASYYNGWSPEPRAADDPVRQIGGWSLGFSARAGLHLFQVFATNVQNIHTNLVAPGGTTTVPFSKDGANFFVGFNISRKWKL